MDKELVWYPSDKEGWAQGVLVNSIEEPLAKVKTSDGQVPPSRSSSLFYVFLINIIPVFVCSRAPEVAGTLSSLSLSSKFVFPSTTRFSVPRPQVLEFKRKFIMKMNEGTLKIVDDMITLDEINEPIILNNIKQRYLKDHIYVRRAYLARSRFPSPLYVDIYRPNARICESIPNLKPIRRAAHSRVHKGLERVDEAASLRNCSGSSLLDHYLTSL
jgi:hypothetical protein